MKIKGDFKFIQRSKFDWQKILFLVEIELKEKNFQNKSVILYLQIRKNLVFVFHTFNVQKLILHPSSLFDLFE